MTRSTPDATVCLLITAVFAGLSTGATFRFTVARHLCIDHRRLIEYRRHDNSRLLESRFGHALVSVHVGVMRPDVVVLVALHRLETRQTHRSEREMIRRSNALWRRDERAEIG